MSVGVPHGAGDLDSRDSLELVDLVERDVVHDVDLARAKLVHAGVAGSEEAKEELFDRGAPAPVVFVSREEEVLPRSPFLHLVGTGSDGLSVVLGKGVQVLPLENVAREGAPPELVLIRRVDPPIGDDGREIVRSLDRLDEVEALGRLRVVARVVDGLDGEGDVPGVEGLAVVPANSGRSFQVTSSRPSSRTRTRPFSGEGITSARTGTASIFSFQTVRPSEMQIIVSSRMCVEKRLSVSGSRS